jgi:23S rRNA (cytidine1920-2'-O)/16S rRNA (cytidine1409-2'-O)-methyltransferase
VSAPARTVRLDQALVERGLAPTRAKAQALILAGRVRSTDRRLDKPGSRVGADTPLEVEPGPRYVGRGGHKLRGALDRFALALTDLAVLDVGASTGGFTQVALEDGARLVLALDVGRGQLDWSLRTDPRVHPVEGINARHLEPGLLPAAPDVAVIDVSFISLALVLPAVSACLPERSDIVALVKPQFEVGRRDVGRGGIVRDPALHRSALEGVSRTAEVLGWAVVGVIPSPIRGVHGNVEYFLHLRRGPGVPAPEPLADLLGRALDEVHPKEVT